MKKPYMAYVSRFVALCSLLFLKTSGNHTHVEIQGGKKMKKFSGRNLCDADTVLLTQSYRGS